MAVFSFDSTPRMLQIDVPIGWLRPFDPPRWIDFDHQNWVRCAVGDVAPFRALLTKENGRWANWHLAASFTLPIHLVGLSTEIHIDAGHFLDQRTVMRAVPRFIEMELLVQLLLFEVREYRDAPAQKRSSV